MTTHTKYINGYKVGLLRYRILTAIKRQTTYGKTAWQMDKEKLIFIIGASNCRITPTNYRTVIWYDLTEAGKAVAEALR